MHYYHFLISSPPALSMEGELSNEDDTGESGGLEGDILLSPSMKADNVGKTALTKCDCVVPLLLNMLVPATFRRAWMAACNIMHNPKYICNFNTFFNRLTAQVYVHLRMCKHQIKFCKISNLNHVSKTQI